MSSKIFIHLLFIFLLTAFIKYDILIFKKNNIKGIKMGFKNIFGRKETAVKTVYPEAQNSYPDYGNNFAEINERLGKIETKQKEISLQLDDIGETIDNPKDIEMAEAMIAIADNIENFYRFTQENNNESLSEQARIMWESAKKSIEGADIEIIEDRGCPPNVKRHSTETAGRDENIPHGYIIGTLRCGYVYKGEVLRKASVKINNQRDAGPN